MITFKNTHTHIKTHTQTSAHSPTRKRTGNTDEFSHGYSFSNRMCEQSSRSAEGKNSIPSSPRHIVSFKYSLGFINCQSESEWTGRGVCVLSDIMRASKLKLIKLLSGNFSRNNCWNWSGETFPNDEATTPTVGLLFYI